MDSFKESVSKTIQQAQTLAEKLEAIADAKEKLANGSSGLVGADEKAEATLFVSEEDEKLQEKYSKRYFPLTEPLRNKEMTSKRNTPCCVLPLKRRATKNGLTK